MWRVPAARCWLVLPCLLLSSAGCDDLSDFRGEFDGSIVAGNFIRNCFADDTTATLVFDPEHAVAPLGDLPPALRNRLSTSDKTFQNTILEPISALPHDQLSELDFPGPRRLRNYLLLARPAKGPLAGRDATVVVSLLDDERVEVRIIARTAETSMPCPDERERDDAGADEEQRRVREYFGLFRLKIKP